MTLVDDDIVSELTQAGMSDKWIMKNIGMDKDELACRKAGFGAWHPLFADQWFFYPHSQSILPEEWKNLI